MVGSKELENTLHMLHREAVDLTSTNVYLFVYVERLDRYSAELLGRPTDNG
jgi:hypothetical protein